MKKSNMKSVSGHRILACVLALCSVPGLLSAQERKIPDTYMATTVNMSPADVELKIDVLEWSDDEQRAAVVAALNDGENATAALQKLPTLGVVWRSGSAVGSSIKYAVRETAADGGEIVTLVTDRRVGATSFSPWQADAPIDVTPPEYSVIVLNTADASGTMSLAANVVIDANSNTVRLERGGASPVLSSVVKAPRPYWASAQN